MGKKKDKNIWMALNQGQSIETSSQVVCRCNGTLGSVYVDDNNKTHYHYEPVIQPSKLSSYGQWINDVSVDPKGAIILIAQYNKYTAQYYMNQRFIYGAIDPQITKDGNQIIRKDFAQVYKVTNIIKDESQTTFDPNDIGIIRIYLDVDQLGELDDVPRRIAYNDVVPDPNPRKDYIDEDEKEIYSLQVVEPTILPDHLGNEDMLIQLAVFDHHHKDTLIKVNISDVSLTGSMYAEYADVNDFVELSEVSFNTFKLHRKKSELTFSVKLLCEAEMNDEPALNLSFEFRLWGD